MSFRGFVLLTAAAMLGLQLLATPASAGQRVALVVGNGGYDPEHAPTLLNPVNDARLMARSLETSGFEVQLVTDADQAAMKEAIKAFGKRLVEAGGDTVGLFYFAGHGVEDRGQNYLIPLGAEIESEVDFHTDAVLMDWVLARMRKAGNRLNMVILDACRNNPFEGRYRGASQGLAQMNAPSGSLIAYAAAPKQVAYDGEGENSPYTAALAEALVVPGLKIEDVFKRVRVAVEEATNGEQTPWENSSLRGDFYFVSKVEELPPPQPVITDGPEDPKPEPAAPGNDRRLTAEELAAERVFWESIKDSEHAADFEAYLEQFPGGTYAALARNRLARLTGRQEEKPVVQVAITPDEPEPVVSPEPPRPTPESIETALGLDRDERRRIQQGLALLGFDPGPADGLFGQRTRDAVGKWQASQGAPATGYLDADTARTLLAKAEAGLEPFGPDWIFAENQPCQLWDASGVSGDEVVTWSGACVDGKASGQGRVVWLTPRGVYVSEGSFREGKEHGHGTYIWPNGNRYEGEYRNGKRHGHGTFTWADGDRYEGEYRDDKPNGWGVGTFESSGVYEGHWANGCFEAPDGKRAAMHSTFEECGFNQANSCRYANDGVCDEPNLCQPGTDTADCNSCRYAGDGVCDVPQYCEPGTDTADCANSCRWARDGMCDEPGLCQSGTDTADCS